MSKLLKILGIVFLVFIVIGVIASLGDDKPKAATATGSTENKTEAAEPPAIPVTAPQLAKEYDANEVTADNTYKNKAIIVTGVVERIAKDITDDPYVILGSGEEMSLTSVQCTFDKSDNSLASLHKGQKLSIQGTVKGKMMNVLLEDCSIK